MAGSIQYIKIAKIDKNGVDLTTQLESINTLVLPSGSSFAEYTIKNKSRFRDYFLYYVTPPDRNNISNAVTSSLKYDFTGSLGGVGSEIDLGVGGVAVPYPTLTGSIGSQSITYDTLQERIQLTTSPQKDLHLRTSAFYVTSSAEVIVDLFKADSILSPGSITRLTTSEAIIAGGIKGPFIRQLSITGSNTGDVFFLGATANSFPISGGPFVSVSGPLDGLKLTPFNIFISSSAATGGNIQTIIEPYFTTDFYSSEYNVLQNNATKGIPNQLLQNVDYNSGIIPTNIEAIMSGSAVKADIPQSHNTISSLINPRYNRSIVQSSDFNVFSSSAGLTDFGDPVNIGTFGQTPSVSSLDNTIVEFNWGGGSNPEIPLGGSFNVSNILLEVSGPDDVKLITPGTNIREFLQTITYISGSGNLPALQSGSVTTIEERDDYYEIFNRTFGPGKSLIPFEYNPSGTPTIPAFTKVIDTTIEVPTRSIYAISSSYVNTGTLASGFTDARFGTWTNNTPFISVAASASIAFLKTDYATDRIVPLTNPNNFQNLITNDIKLGHRWFITILNSLDFPISVTEESQIFRYKGETATELNKRGVFEIQGVFKIEIGSLAIIAMYMKNTNESGSDIILGNGNKGFLIWKSPTAYKRKALIVDKQVSGVGAGGFYSLNTQDVVRENFEDITKEYGSNQTG